MNKFQSIQSSSSSSLSVSLSLCLIRTMLHRRWLPFSLVITFLFCCFSSLFYFSHGDSQFPRTSEWRNEGIFAAKLSKVITLRRSFVVEGPISEPIERSLFVLAAEKTRRKDPLTGFKKYTDGWNISGRHYWASVSFTAAPLFAVAAIWFLGFGLCLGIISLCYFCCERKTYDYSPKCYAISLFFLSFFTVAAIGGCIVLYTGQGKFHNTTSNTLDYVLSQADNTVQKLKTVSDFLAAAKQTGVDQVFLPSDVQSEIDQIQTKISAATSILADQTTENSNNIRDLLDSMRLALIIIAAVMLLLTFLGFLFSIFGIQLLVYILVITGWILVAGTFILSSTYLVLHNAAADTCVSMDEWVRNPAAHTALDDILSCVDNATAQETLVRTKEVSGQLVDLINQVLTNVSNINFSPNFKPLYFNQSGSLVPLLCNPVYPDLTDRACAAGEASLENATEVWRNYVCEVSADDICTTPGRLTPAFYDQMSSGVNTSYALYNYGPFLVELQDCSFVRRTFYDIFNDHCPGLRLYSRWIYIGLVMVSTSVMLSLIFWVIHGRERSHRLRTKEFMTGSEENLEEDKVST